MKLNAETAMLTYSFFLSVMIIFFSLASVFYNIKSIKLNKKIKENYPVFRHGLPLIISFIWIIFFSFAIVNILFLHTPILDEASIGVVIGRGILVLSMSERASFAREKYYSALNMSRRIKKLEEENDYDSRTTN